MSVVTVTSPIIIKQEEAYITYKNLDLSVLDIPRYRKLNPAESLRLLKSILEEHNVSILPKPTKKTDSKKWLDELSTLRKNMSRLRKCFKKQKFGNVVFYNSTKFLKKMKNGK